MERIYIFKIGGSIIESAELLATFIKGIKNIPGKVIVIHGGGKTATSMEKALGIESTMVEGRRITSEKSLEVVTMVYAGLLNKKIISQLQKSGINAIGLSGADADLIRTKKRIPGAIDYGFAGDIDNGSVNDAELIQIVERDLVPVFCSITHDGEGQLLNTNADTIAFAIAEALSPYYESHLYFCFDHPGVMKNGSVIPSIHQELFDQLKNEKTVSDGMLPKIENALAAIEKGVSQVYLSDVHHLMELTTESFSGTTIHHSILFSEQ